MPRKQNVVTYMKVMWRVSVILYGFLSHWLNLSMSPPFGASGAKVPDMVWWNWQYSSVWSFTMQRRTSLLWATGEFLTKVDLVRRTELAPFADTTEYKCVCLGCLCVYLSPITAVWCWAPGVCQDKRVAPEGKWIGWQTSGSSQEAINKKERKQQWRHAVLFF